jgi:hypothetical protein
MAGGRPLKFKSVKELSKLIDAYFLKCTHKDGKELPFTEWTPITITGLALALDTTRHTLIDYEEKDEYLHTIKIAKTKVENYAEMKAFGANPAGAIFALKNFGWADKLEVDQSTKMEVKISNEDAGVL